MEGGLHCVVRLQIVQICVAGLHGGRQNFTLVVLCHDALVCNEDTVAFLLVIVASNCN